MGQFEEQETSTHFHTVQFTPPPPKQHLPHQGLHPRSRASHRDRTGSPRLLGRPGKRLLQNHLPSPRHLAADCEDGDGRAWDVTKEHGMWWSLKHTELGVLLEEHLAIHVSCKKKQSGTKNERNTKNIKKIRNCSVQKKKTTRTSDGLSFKCQSMWKTPHRDRQSRPGTKNLRPCGLKGNMDIELYA